MKFKVGNITKSIVPLAGGAVGASLLIGIVKKADKSGKFEKFAPVAPILLGGFLVASKKTQMWGYGMIAGGAAKLAGNLVPALAGVEDMDLSGVFGMLNIGATQDTLNDDLEVGAATLNGPNEYERAMVAGYDTY